MPTATHSKR